MTKRLVLRSSGYLVIWLLLAATSLVAQKKPVEWPYYGGDQGGMKYSALEQIDRGNVANLKLAWDWKSGEQPKPEFRTNPGAFQATPIMIDNVLYFSTSYNRVIALDAETGKELWAYDPRRTKKACRRAARASSTAAWPRGATATSCASS